VPLREVNWNELENGQSIYYHISSLYEARCSVYGPMKMVDVENRIAKNFNGVNVNVGKFTPCVIDFSEL
jgi:hypothetical protein